MKDGVLPNELYGTLSHTIWTTIGQRQVFLWTRKHGLTGHNLKVLELIVKFCIQYYKIYFDIKVKHYLEVAPYHIPAQLRILKTQPKIIRDAVIFYIRTGAWYTHHECLLLSLLASSNYKDRNFAVDQIIKLRGYERQTKDHTKDKPLCQTATSLRKLISSKPGEVAEPVFTCSLSTKRSKSYVILHMLFQSSPVTFRPLRDDVKLVTEAEASVAGPESREGYTRDHIQHRESILTFLCTFD